MYIDAFIYIYFCIKVLDPLKQELDSCELLCGYWELNPDPLEGQAVLFIAKSSLQSNKWFLTELKHQRFTETKVQIRQACPLLFLFYTLLILEWMGVLVTFLFL